MENKVFIITPDGRICQGVTSMKIAVKETTTAYSELSHSISFRVQVSKRQQKKMLKKLFNIYKKGKLTYKTIRKNCKKSNM